MATGEDAATSVRRWLEKSGFPLQMKVAHALNDAGPDDIEQGGYYRDVLEGKWREFDIAAEWTGHPSDERTNSFIVCVECKNSHNPWVVFVDDGVSGAAQLSGTLALNAMLGHTKNVSEDTFDDFVLEVSHGIPDFYLDQHIGGFAKAAHSKEDEPHDAIRQAVSAARGILKERLDLSGDDNSEAMLIAVPVVVTTSRLFACQLEIETGNFSLEEYNTIAVRAPRDEIARNIAPTVRLVTLGGLDAFVDELRGLRSVVGPSLWSEP